ncbi:MocR-like pyridoxine biosynthesis transcription factor PdxR [Actinacidiphila paucisporea]|uniref:Transcriptional regulator, GntR family n=1 Tax=Actinacidiphila paucisporea TaxID=310782 RepID=A0A1M7F7H5_9ACTN|nr:PLP-dependent aminotransferase family protein [Actinacidiphila paucisporea]SHM00014.1 transcriptional regulator, GntR family [Actinacidiphila paucisporea]
MDDSWPTSAAGEHRETGVDLHLDLPPGTSQGRRAALERALRDAVRHGRLAPGSRLPSSRRLAEQTGLSRGTVKAAYDQLTAEGYLTARQGSGTVVADRPQGPSPQPPGRSAATRPPRHDLRPGSPDVTSFPTSAWLRATRRALGAVPSAAYDYGDPRGRAELRAALAEYLGRTRGVVADPDRIVVVSGYVQGLALLTAVLGRPVVGMEDPGLPFHREVVRRAGGRVVPLPVDEHGAGAGGDLPRMDAVVVTPAHQYPTGVTLHPARRHALTDWARAGGGLVIEDDYDGEFRYDRQPVGALQGTAPDQVVYLGTASKTLGPALRLGWMVLPPHLVRPVAEAKLYSDYHTGAVGQLALADLIADHAYDRHVRASRLRYRRRRDLLVERLEGAAVRPGVELRGIAAGLHALVSLPQDGPDEAATLRRATAEGLAVDALGGHWHGADGGDRSSPGRPRGLIVGYGTPGEGAYPAALAALTRVLRP